MFSKALRRDLVLDHLEENGSNNNGFEDQLLKPSGS